MDPMKKATNKYYIATKRKTMTINYKKKNRNIIQKYYGAM